MSELQGCKTCAYENETGIAVDRSKTQKVWASIIGIGQSSIGRHWEHSDKNAKTTESPTGSYKWEFSESDFDGNSPAYDREISSNDVEDFLRTKGLNPDEWDYTFRFSEWEQRSKDGGVHTLHAFRVTGRRKATPVSAANLDYITEYMRTWELPKAETRFISDSSFVLIPTDFQIGKVDWNGGTPETIDQVMSSFARAGQFAVDTKPKEIVLIDAGDIVENIYSTSSQLGTNDLGLPHQVAAAFELMLAGIKLLAPLSPSLKYVCVPSNHGSHRLAPKSPAGAVHEDWGIMLAKIIRTAVKLSPSLQHVEVIIPDDYHDSLSFTTAETCIGVVHGHQTGSPDKIGDWWKGQSHGNMPTARARILVTGHWHSLRVQQSGDARYIIVGAASDRGSSWFTNNRGERSDSGIVGFTTRRNDWADLQIF